jgi:hypothetical protein
MLLGGMGCRQRKLGLLDDDFGWGVLLRMLDVIGLHGRDWRSSVHLSAWPPCFVATLFLETRPTTKDIIRRRFE